MNKTILVNEIRELKKQPMSLDNLQKLLILFDGLVTVCEQETDIVDNPTGYDLRGTL